MSCKYLGQITQATYGTLTVVSTTSLSSDPGVGIISYSCSNSERSKILEVAKQYGLDVIAPNHCPFAKTNAFGRCPCINT